MKRYKVYTKEKGLIATNDYNDFVGLTLHREDGSAYTEYDYTNTVTFESYWVGNKQHRLDGPASITYINGAIVLVEYYINNLIHRADGPAYIEYDISGNIETTGYYIENIQYTKCDYDKELMKRKVNLL